MRKKILDVVSVIFLILFALFGCVESESMVGTFLTAFVWIGFCIVLKLKEMEDMAHDQL